MPSHFNHLLITGTISFAAFSIGLPFPLLRTPQDGAKEHVPTRTIVREAKTTETQKPVLIEAKRTSEITDKVASLVLSHNFGKPDESSILALPPALAVNLQSSELDSKLASIEAP